MKYKTICIVPARKGSKSIKHKNLRKVKGKELIKYTLDVCKKLKKDFFSVISTDSKKILNISKKYKLYFNGLRPPKLSGDKALTYDVLKYEVLLTEKKLRKKFDYILLLQPTCPFRSIEKIKKALKIIRRKKYDSVISISDVGANHPERMKIIKNNKLVNYTKNKYENLKPRQSLQKVFIRSGSIYLINRKSFFKYKSFVGRNCFGLVVSKKESINIDNKNDLLIANLS